MPERSPPLPPPLSTASHPPTPHPSHQTPPPLLHSCCSRQLVTLPPQRLAAVTLLLLLNKPNQDKFVGAIVGVARFTLRSFLEMRPTSPTLCRELRSCYALVFITFYVSLLFAKNRSKNKNKREYADVSDLLYLCRRYKLNLLGGCGEKGLSRSFLLRSASNAGLKQAEERL